MENLSLLTYTHSKAKDVHPAYFGRLTKYFPQMNNSYVACNETTPYGISLVYNDSDSHAQHMMNSLDKIPTQYVIYCQEDYILFDYVDVNKLEEFVSIMETDSIPFIRLIDSGVGKVNKIYNEELSYIDTSSPYYFSTQATIWNKTVLYNMFGLSNIKTIFQEPENTPYLLSLTNRGLFTTNRGKAVGGHYNSVYYPYIATAVVKGKWNVSEYNDEIQTVAKEYNINILQRGVR